jgi:hypothetical protein
VKNWEVKGWTFWFLVAGWTLNAFLLGVLVGLWTRA